MIINTAGRGNASGHAIKDPNGTTIDQPTIKFQNLNVTNDTTNQQIVVEGKKRSTTTRILSASSWTNSQYDLSTLYPNATYDIEVSVCNSTTDAQLAAWNTAQPVGSATSNVVIAKGTVPTIDITVMVTSIEK